jgi:hypothetical protein
VSDRLDTARQGGPAVSDRLRHAARRIDPFMVLVGIVGLVVYALHGSNGALTRDLALYTYAGQRVADGVPPYVGVLNRAGPLAHLLPGAGAAIARLGGFDELATMRVLFLLFAVATVCAVYALGRALFGSVPVALVTAAAFLTYYGFIDYAFNGPREKTPMTLFIVLALLAMVRQRWLTAGLFASLATLCLQVAFFTAVTGVVAGALFLVPGVRGRLVALVRIGIGGLIPVAVFLAYTVVTRSLQESLDGFVRLNARYTTSDPVGSRLDIVWEGLVDAYGVTLWICVVGLVAVGVAGVAAVVPALRRRFPMLPTMAALAVATVVSMAWNTQEFDAWPDLFPLLPVASVGIGALAHVVIRPLPVKVGTVVVVAVALVATTIAFDHSLGDRDERLTIQRDSVAGVLDVLPDPSIISVEAPQALVLTSKTNPTRHQMFSGGLWEYVTDTWPGGLQGYRRWIVEQKPDLIVFGDPVSPNWWNSVRGDYVYVGSAPDWFWMARKSLGQEKLTELQAAIKAAGHGKTPPMDLVEVP